MSFDPIPALGEGADAFNAPALFYLSHRRLIDEWASLRPVASKAVSDWLGRAFRDRLAHEVAGLQLRVAYVSGPGAFHHVVAYPENMTVLGSRPVLGIGLGWSSKSVDPEMSGSMFSCVRASRNKTGRAAAQVFVDNGGRAFRLEHGLRGSDDDTWPVFKNLQTGERWWTRLDAFCESLIDESMTLVNGMLPALHAAASVGDQGGPDEAE